ncbi:MAG: hypothetical protein DCC66_12580, partial [Planctomycetota bacterium]
PDKTNPGACGCGIPDTDANNDGVPDCFSIDLCPNDPDKIAPGTCGCGTPDTDTDGDGTPDCLDDDDGNTNGNENQNNNGNSNCNDNEPALASSPEACGVTCGPGMGTMMPLVGLFLVGMRRRRRARPLPR